MSALIERFKFLISETKSIPGGFSDNTTYPSFMPSFLQYISKTLKPISQLMNCKNILIICQTVSFSKGFNIAINNSEWCTFTQ